MLWPGALAGLSLACAALMPESLNRWTTVAILAIGGIATLLAIRAGHSQEPFPWGEAAPWLILELGVLATAAMLASRGGRAQAGGLLVGVLGLSLVLITAQYLQNGRGFIGWFSQFPFASAYVDFGVGKDMETKVRVQQWLLDRTSPEDRIAIWTDPDRLLSAVAAMQLWGADNLVTSQPVLQQGDIERLEQMRPSVIAMYAPSREMIDAFAASLPAWSQPSDLVCTDVPLADTRVSSSTACLVRLTWLD